MQKIKDFWVESYQTDPVAFYHELVAFILTVYASGLLALTATDPNMLLIYPPYFVGSITQCYACYRRGAAFVMVLSGYFAIINVFGFAVAMEWIRGFN
jgi:hypothetical protein